MKIFIKFFLGFIVVGIVLTIYASMANHFQITRQVSKDVQNGDQASSQNHFVKAVTDYQAALSIDPNNSAIQNKLQFAKVQQGMQSVEYNSYQKWSTSIFNQVAATSKLNDSQILQKLMNLSNQAHQQNISLPVELRKINQYLIDFLNDDELAITTDQSNPRDLTDVAKYFQQANQADDDFERQLDNYYMNYINVIPGQ